MKKLFALLLLVSSYAFGGSVTGQIQTATQGPIVNGTLTFTLSQAAVQAGSATIATSSVACYTDRGGNIVSQPDPLVAPVVTTNTASGTLAAGTYFTEFSYYDASGVGMASFETTTVLSAQGTIIVAPPVLRPATATGWKIYIGTSTGTETLQSTQTGFGSSYQQTAPLAAGTALPTSNTSVCKLLFNDQLIPSYTGYTVSFVNASGANVSGFPQKWYLSGGASGTVNVSNGTPLYSGVVQYPQAIISNPGSSATQSINGGLSLNGFPLLGISSLSISGNETVGGTLNVTGAFTAGSFTNNLSVFGATTSAQLAGVISDESGTGALVFANTPTLVTPNIGVATATSVNKVAITAPATSATLTVADGKTLTASNSLTLAGTDSTTMTFPSTSGTVVTTGATQTLTTKTLTSPVMTGPTVNTSVAQGSGLKHQRFGATCTTAASAGSVCSSTLTWTAGFADTNYTASCVGSQASGVPILTLSTKAAGTIGISVWSATASAASFASVDCIAMHD